MKRPRDHGMGNDMSSFTKEELDAWLKDVELAMDEQCATMFAEEVGIDCDNTIKARLHRISRYLRGTI